MHETALKKVPCDKCPAKEFAETTLLEGGDRAVKLPDGWRLIWSKTGVSFRCGTCWHDVPTGKFPVKVKESARHSAADAAPA